MWSPPRARGIQPLDVIVQNCFLMSSQAFGKWYMFKLTSPMSATSKESKGEAPADRDYYYSKSNEKLLYMV